MAEAVGGDEDHSKEKSEFPAYARSWIDRFTAWVDRRPGPSWGAGVGRVFSRRAGALRVIVYSPMSCPAHFVALWWHSGGARS